MFKSGYIAILGAPNAGKSTFLNAVVGQKLAAVSNKPQTTRKKFIGIYSSESCQIIFLDTPGIHQFHKKINQTMLAEIDQAVNDADLLCYLISVDKKLDHRVADFFAHTQKRHPHKKSLLLINKIDLPRDKHRVDIEELKQVFKGLNAYPISALKGDGVKAVIQVLEERLQPGPAFFPVDQFSDQNLRDIVAETIREKAMEVTFQEIPYSLAVSIVSFKEGPHLTKIMAHLIVEHESQKGMVIGKGGRMIKKIGVLARPEIERLVDTKVFLELKVKVDKDWTKNLVKMLKYGYR